MIRQGWFRFRLIHNSYGVKILVCLIVRLVKRSLHATRHLPPATLFKSPATRHPLLATCHPLPATRYLSPATRHPLFVTPHPWKSAAEEKWPPLQLLTERLEKQTNNEKKTCKDTSSNSTRHTTGMCKNTSNKPCT